MAQLPLLEPELKRTAQDHPPIHEGEPAESAPLGNAVLVHANNQDWLSTFPAQSMQLIVTSPPYNIGKEYEHRQSLEHYLDMQADVIRECVRLMRPTGSICWQVGNHVTNGEIVPLDIVLYHIFRELGLRLRNRIVWHFGHGLHSKKRLSGRYETILWFTRGDNYTFHLDPIRVPSKYPDKKHFKGPKNGQLSGNPMGKNPSDVWEIPNVKSNHCEKTEHPCQFPIELVERLVLALSDPQDQVLDPFMGVGSTIIAAIKHGRDGFGCDIEQRYVDIAKQRVGALHDGTLKMREMGKPVYDPELPNGGH